jgi:2-oxoglutarate dehydrogenase E2 component (dihydrolipoamide succinyltransferase)
MASIDVRLPEGQQEGSTSTLARWLVAPGATVAAHQPLAEIETDKVMVELASPSSGVLAETLKSEGDPVDPGELIARIETDAASAMGTRHRAAGSPATNAGQPATPSSGGTPGAGSCEATSLPQGTQRDERLSPAVRRMLEQYGLDAAQIAGSGRGGRITTDDVLAFNAGRKSGTAAGAPGATRASAPGAAATPPSEATSRGDIPSHRVPHDTMRKRIAQHMVESLLRTAPHVTSVFEADLSAALAHREEHKRDFADRGARLTITAYIVAAAAKALQAVPEVNARWHDDSLEIYEDVNIGVGTALEDRGLIVPVIRRAQLLDLFGIATRLDTLTRKAREGSLAPEDVRGGTFTISNHGVGGSLIAAPIVINQPQVAILGVGRVQKRAVVVEDGAQDRVVVRPMAYVTLSIDHRALDAFQTNRFLTALVEALEQP